MRYPPRDELTLTKLIICEGPADEAFIRALGKARGITGFCVRNCEDASSDKKGGISKFGETIESVSTWKGFSKLTDIVILADNDMSPFTNFASVQSQIAQLNVQANPKPVFGVPTAVGVKAPGRPAQITILMLPSAGVVGTLETLCLCAAQSVNSNINEKVIDFVRGTGATAWQNLHKIDKLMLRCTIGSQHEKDPALGLGNVWRQAAQLIPLNDYIFNDISTQLQAI